MTASDGGFGFDEIADRLGSPLLLLSLDGRILSANHAAARLLGGVDRREDLVSRPLSAICSRPEQAEDLVRRWSRSSQRTPGLLTLRGIDGRTIECRCSGSVVGRHDGQARCLLVECQPNSGHPSEFVALNQKIEAALHLRIEGLRKELASQTAVLEERQRLGRELHDSVTQALYGAALHAEAAERALAGGLTATVAANLRDIRETVQEALGEMRLLLFELRPPLLAEQGLSGALETRLRAVEARAGLVTEFRGADGARLRPETEQELYRVAQEALTNVLKHAHASRVAVRLDVCADRVRLEVSDDGLGFEPEMDGRGGLGLGGMRERVARLGGALHVDSGPGAGTRVRVEVPR